MHMKLCSYSKQSSKPSSPKQAQLVQEASEALKAVEAKSTARKQEIATLHGQREADIQQAIGQAMVQYWDQLSSA